MFEQPQQGGRGKGGLGVIWLIQVTGSDRRNEDEEDEEV